MWSLERVRHRGRLGTLAALALATLTAGCFQPMYGERSIVGGRGVEQALAAVDVQRIDAPNGSPEARLAVEVRNEVLFGLTGGGGGAAPTHKLTIRLVPSKYSLIVDTATGRPEFENYGIDASYSLIEIATNKVVVNANAVSRVSYDIPGQQQRFARMRALRDAENRAAKVIADQIKSRLASYFVAGT